MALRLVLSDLTLEQKKYIRERCVFQQKESQYSEGQTLSFFKIQREYIYVPLGLWNKFTKKFPSTPRRIKSINIEFKGTLYSKDTDIKGRDQDVVASEALEILKSKHVCFLALPTAMGKTCLATYLTCRLKKKTIFLSFLDIINKQTVQEYEKFTNARVQHIKKDKLDRDADVYICGLRKAYLLWKKHPSCFDDIGLVIVDEAHLVTAFVFTELMFIFRPIYLLGMSATPDRKDGQHVAFDLFFGETIIKRKESKPFKVYKIQTGITPPDKKRYYKGKMVIDMTSMHTWLSENEKRNNMIIRLVKKNLKHKILILCGRVQQCNNLYEAFIKEGITTDILVGNKKDYDQSVNVLVGGIKKAGIGFNDPTRTMMILSMDVSDVRQSEGRLRQINGTIFDFVDNHYVLNNHWKKRRKWYIERGATIVEKKEKDIQDDTLHHTNRWLSRKD